MVSLEARLGPLVRRPLLPALLPSVRSRLLQGFLQVPCSVSVLQSELGVDAQCLEFVEDQLECVTHLDVIDVDILSAERTEALVFEGIKDSDDTAAFTDGDDGLVGVKAFLERKGCAVGDKGVFFHLSQSETAFFGASFGGLSCEQLDWS